MEEDAAGQEEETARQRGARAGKKKKITLVKIVGQDLINAPEGRGGRKERRRDARQELIQAARQIKIQASTCKLERRTIRDSKLMIEPL